MVIALDFQSEDPIYLQIHDQIVMGISKGKLKGMEKLPTTRSLAAELGINTMTVNKAYQLLKQEGFVVTDRRCGVTVKEKIEETGSLSEKSKNQLKLIVSEAKVRGVSRDKLIQIIDEYLKGGDNDEG